MIRVGVLLSLIFCVSTSAVRAAPRIVDDTIPAPVGSKVGDAVSGRAIVANKHVSLCLLCHQAPIAEEKLQGNISSDLAGAGARWTAAQLRLRLINPRRLNPNSIMPAYYHRAGLNRVHPQWRGKPIFDAQQIEDVIAYLVTLK